MSTNYISPSRKLFHARHKLTRNQLQDTTTNSNTNARATETTRTDWTTAHDITIDTDSELIAYAVPFIVPMTTNKKASSSSTASFSQNGNTRSTVYSARSSSFLSESSIFSSNTYETNEEDSLSYKLRKNISVDSLIQDNKRRMAEHEESLQIFKESTTLQRQASRDLQKLKYANRALLRRKYQLDLIWNDVKQNWDDDTILMTIRKRSLAWFGLPVELRFSIYNLCLYDTPSSRETVQSDLYIVIERCVKMRAMARRIWFNFKNYGNVNWLLENQTTPSNLDSSHSTIEMKFFQRYQGLYYHLRDHLKLNIFIDFLKPLLWSSLIKGLNGHFYDGIALELLDILIFANYYNELSNKLLNEILFAVLDQCYFKFFVNDFNELQYQLNMFKPDLVQILEAIRKDHEKQITK
ncbi:hypothetical protein NCAS_0J00550 [Naumovozyma castellii]|uniref:Uncharacterized protein n=1 Tax=Naumovozyma castellii TaxID=27288 RepID=G0VKJ7_NAUCA|nr:hypothetical protein NCAS_0J00550 [Naumovozyma castellii CBS 4309]CCC72034.1 hypothetical protein NCAS_0J00550 [Naumovozyma castellii CBS 4309]